jgi:phosphatidyl-myo-inositol alpha-mannosyltransferase
VRIALVCPYDWCAPGGAQVHVRELAGRLRALGRDVLVVAPSSRRLDDAGVRVVGSPIPIAYNGARAPIDPRPWHVGHVRAALQAFRPDVVHVHEPFAPSTSMWAVLAADAPIVATFHAASDRSLLFDAASPLLRRVAARIDARIAVSERAAAFVRARVPGEYRIIPNGIDVSVFARAEPADLGPGRKILFVGRLQPRKGFGVAVEAFRDLAATHDDIRLVVVGAGAEARAVEALPPAVRERVQLLGAVSNRELAPVHRACDVFVAPSLGGESFGVVLLEAMAARLPVVASRIRGYDEVIEDGTTGLLVRPRDPGAVANAVRKVLDDRELASRLSAAAGERAGRYDWVVVAGEVDDVYRGVVGGASGRRGDRPPVR